MAAPSTRDVNLVTAYPKSGITFLSHLLFRALFERPDDWSNLHKDYIIDIHQHPDRFTIGEGGPFYVKSHFAFGPVLPLRARARRAILLVRDPIDVMMSAWDYKHLTGEGNLHLLSEAVRAPLFRQFVADWISSGGQAYPINGPAVGGTTSLPGSISRKFRSSSHATRRSGLVRPKNSGELRISSIDPSLRRGWLSLWNSAVSKICGGTKNAP